MPDEKTKMSETIRKKLKKIKVSFEIVFACQPSFVVCSRSLSVSLSFFLSFFLPLSLSFSLTRAGVFGREGQGSQED
jgi:hypothetical protein